MRGKIKTDGDMLDALKDVCNKLGRFPKRNEFKINNLSNEITYEARFGSLNNAHAHHLHINNHDDVLYVPGDMHQHIWHSNKDESSMLYINNIAFTWWLDNQFISAFDDCDIIIINAFNINLLEILK
jgi:hypothetical protein